MKVQFERDGVAVEAAAGPDGRVTMLDVSVADGALKLRVHPTMFDGRTSWTISGMPGAFTSSTFTAAWEHLYEVVHDGRTYDLRRAIAEIVDAQGTVTAPGTGMSAAIEKCKKTLSDFEHRYMAAEVVQLQRSLLADQGYSSGPDLVRVKELWTRGTDCFAYHDIIGTVWDRTAESKDGVTLKSMAKYNAFYQALHDFLDS